MHRKHTSPSEVAGAILPLDVIIGLTASAILKVFPDLKPEDIRSALLTAVDTVCDQHAVLLTGDSVDAMIAQAQQSSGLSDEAAMELAVSETRALRRERAARLP